MSNGARHGLGVVIGLLVTPVIAMCLMYGTSKLTRFVQIMAGDSGERWAAAGVLLIAAVLVGLVAGTRVSPLASLIPGAAFAVVGFLWVAAPRWSFENSPRDLLTGETRNGYLIVAPSGFLLVLGIGLLVASVAPSRWQARVPATPRYGGPPPAPMGPPPLYGGAPAPMGAPHQLQPPQAPPSPSPSSSPSPWQGTPQYGPGPGASNPPPLPSSPSSSPSPAPAEQPRASGSGSDDDDEPGEWTRMYGGNR
ncbi:hypothetical protein GCM10022254_43080 [Actinomadura meridiana]|uniref:Uncharacterized protein n=1 Tax=Actinomadura meridiana TaxID=559626 RepID=A0ABP8C8J8_9ACTN